MNTGQPVMDTTLRISSLYLPGVRPDDCPEAAEAGDEDG